jgi:hypothetical protein
MKKLSIAEASKIINDHKFDKMMFRLYVELQKEKIPQDIIDRIFSISFTTDSEYDDEGGTYKYIRSVKLFNENGEIIKSGDFTDQIKEVADDIVNVSLIAPNNKYLLTKDMPKEPTFYIED